MIEFFILGFWAEVRAQLVKFLSGKYENLGLISSIHVSYHDFAVPVLG